MNAQTLLQQASKHVGTVMNAFNVYKLLNDRFLPEYRKSQQVENICLNEALYSCILQGQVDLETNKRKAIVLQKECLTTLESFLNKLPYDRVFHQDFIMELNQGNKIDFSYILQHLDNYTYRPDEPEIQILNDQLNEIGNICLDYFIQSFKQEQLELEIYFQLDDFREKIFKKIRKIAKSKAGNVYTELEQFIKQQAKYELTNQRFAFLNERWPVEDLRSLKPAISNQFEQFEKEMLDNLEYQYNFHLNNIILSKYEAKINETYLRTIKNALRIYYNLHDVNHNHYIHSITQRLFLNYLKTRQFQSQDLMMVNKELQDVILSHQWNQQSTQMQYALQILQYLRSLARQSANVQLEEFEQIKFQKSRIQQSQDRLSNLDDLQVIKLIFELFIVISSITIDKEGFLELGQYEANKRIVIVHILRYLSNLKFGYVNIKILNIFESLSGKIYQSVLQNRVWKDSFDLQINDEQMSIKMKEQSFVNLRQKHRLSLLLDISFDQNDQYHAALNNSQKQYITETLNQAHLNFIRDLPPPKYFFFERISPPQHRSSMVTICISGLTSENEDKQENWKALIREDGPIVYALHWESSSMQNIAQSIISRAAMTLIATGTSAAGILLGSLGVYAENPYTQAESEASLVGQFLGVLIGELRIFGDAQINIVSFSLGTSVCLECIKQLDKIYERNPVQIVNEVMLMGGVADCYELSKLRWHSVAGNIYNVYSKKDLVIRWLLQAMKLLTTPCGKTKVNLGYRKVTNCDFTSLIDGHNQFKKNLTDILIQTDFDNDYKVIYSD